jgi:2-methylcitrate dehydratase
VRLRLRDGRTLCREQHDYEGFHTRPMGWETVAAKFDRLASRHADDGLRARSKDAVARLDAITVDELADALASVPSTDEESR